VKTLTLAKDLKLPIDAVTQTFLIVGKRGSGKSNTAARLVEQFHAARLPFVVLDPVDTWWGLKAGRDGGRGLDVYVFGGRHQDLPLEAHGGALLAEVLCEHRISMVLSVKHLSGRERSAFMVQFAQTLFQKWQGGPLHVVLEEAHEFAPQMAGSRAGSNQDNEAAMLGAFKRLWKLGRASGIGGSAVTQRPASLSKDITTQSEILVAHRTIGPQDVAAIGEWVKYHGERLDLLAELPGLPTGEAFVWSPEFPEGKPIGLQRTAVLLRDTYDSASTPKVGEQRVEPKELAPVDLERLRTKLAATIEKAKADDPRELKRQIADLQRQLSSKKVTLAPDVQSTKALLTDADRALLKDLADACRDRTRKADEVLKAAESRADAMVQRAVAEYLSTVRNVNLDVASEVAKTLERVGLQKILTKLEGVAVVMPGGRSTAAPGPGRATSPARVTSPLPVASSQFKVHSGAGGQMAHDGASSPRSVARATSTAATGLPPGEHATLTAALQYEGLDRKRLGILTGYKRSSRDAYIARLAQKGLVQVQGAQLFATDAGRAALNGSFEPLPTGQALVEHWRQRLPEGERRTLDVLLDAKGGDVAREVIDDTTGYKRSSRDAYLVRLKARGLVEFAGRGMVRASSELFD
jgi:hypothetical protein